jgi:hypothetical protein
MKSLSKKNVKKNTKKRLGKSKKHNKSKKTHKKSRKQQKGGFVINEYVGIQNIPETATKDIQNAKSYEEYRETCNYKNQDKNQYKLKELRDKTLETTIARLHKLIMKEHEYMTQPIKNSDHKYLHLIKPDYIKKNENFKYFPGNLNTIVELDNQFKEGKWKNYKIIISNIYCIKKVFDETEFKDDETNTIFKIKVKKDYSVYLKEHDDLVTELFGYDLADDLKNLNTKGKNLEEFKEEFKEEDKEPKKSFLPSISNIFSR